MYYSNEKGDVKAVGQADSWSKPAGFDHAKWASFICDAHIVNSNQMIKQAAQMVRSNELKLPLYFNLYVGDIPNWVTSSMHRHAKGHVVGQHHHHDGSGDVGHDHYDLITSHGGAHPTEKELAIMHRVIAGPPFAFGFNVVDALSYLHSHGGAHPAMPKNTINIALS